MKTRTRIAAVSTVGVLAAATGILVVHVRAPRAPLPPASASVTEVTADYLEAAKAHDCGYTRAMGVPDGTWAWCSNPRLLGYDHVGTPYQAGKYSVSVPETCVAFDITTTGSSDGSMPAGSEPWGFCFVRTPHGWRLYSQGQG